MVTTFSPLFWTFAQVTLLSFVAILISALCRGRAPHRMTAVLGGSMIAILILSAYTFIPPAHWSVTNYASRLIQSDERDADNSNALTSATSRFSPATTQVSSLQENAEHTSINAAIAQPPIVESKQLAQLLRSGTAAILTSLKWIDGEIHNVETYNNSQPAASLNTIQLLFGVGFAIAILFWVTGYLWMRKVVYTSSIEMDPVPHDIAANYCMPLRFTRQVEFRISDKVATGATVGWRRCIILLHPQWRSWSDAELRSVIAHELAHAARADFAWVILSSFVRILYFFHPLVQLTIRRLRIEQELAADQIAASLLGDAQCYGRSLASLTLRCQASIRTRGPVLAAEQLDIIRRIRMIKQGRLKTTVVKGGHWKWIPVVVVAFTLPLSGLRGTPPADDKENSVKSAAVESDSPAANQESLSLAFNGHLAYRPGSFANAERGHIIHWINTLPMAIVVGQDSQPDQALSGQATINLHWTDAAKEHGGLSFGASISDTINFQPHVVSRMQQRMSMAPKESRLIVEKEILGHIVTGVINRNYDRATKTWITPTDAEPDDWILDDELGYLSGTLDQIREFISTGKRPTVSIPEETKAELDSSSLAIVFDNIPDWLKQLENWMGDSPRRQEFSMLMPVFNNLQRFSLLVSGEQQPALSIRMKYASAESASEALPTMTALLDIALAGLRREIQSNPQLKSTINVDVFDDWTFRQDGSTIQMVVQLNIIEPLIAMAVTSAPNASPWQYFPENFRVELDNEPLQQAKKVYRRERSDAAFMAPPETLVQHIDATPYRNKRIRLELASMVSPIDAPHAGLMLWATNQYRESVAFASRSIDGKSDIHSVMSWHVRDEDSREPNNLSLRPASSVIDLDIPGDATTITLGLYIADSHGDFVARGFKLSEIGKATNLPPQIAPFRVNPLLYPGSPIHAQPQDLDLQSAQIDDANRLETTTTEIATRDKDNANRK